MSTNVTMAYLKLAEQLLAAADRRPDERPRLANAAHTAKRLADLARHADAVATGWLDKAADLLRPGVDGPIDFAVVHSADTYADMVNVHIRHLADERRAAAEREQREAVRV